MDNTGQQWYSSVNTILSATDNSYPFKIFGYFICFISYLVVFTKTIGFHFLFSFHLVYFVNEHLKMYYKFTVILSNMHCTYQMPYGNAWQSNTTSCCRITTTTCLLWYFRHVCDCVRVYVCGHVRVQDCVCGHMHPRLYACMACIWIRVHTNVFVYESTRVRESVCVCVCGC